MILNLSFASKMVRRSDTPAPCSSRRLGFIWFLPPTYDPLPTSVLFRRRFNASGKKNTQWWPPHPFRKVRSVLAAETKRNETNHTYVVQYCTLLTVATGVAAAAISGHVLLRAFANFRDLKQQWITAAECNTAVIILLLCKKPEIVIAFDVWWTAL